MMAFLNIPEILDFLVANLGLLEKSSISIVIPGFLGYLSVLDIPEMIDFINIPEIPDFFRANLGIPDNSMTSGRFPHAKRSENKTSPRETFPRNRKKTVSGKSFSGNASREKFSRGKVSRGKVARGEMFLGGEWFPQCPDFPDLLGFRDFWDSLASRISLKSWIFQLLRIP